MKKAWKIQVGFLLLLIGFLTWQETRQDDNGTDRTVISSTSGFKTADPFSPSVFETPLASEAAAQTDVFAAFDAWRNHHPTSSAERTDWIQQGLALAHLRLSLLARFAREYPERATSRLLTLAELADLPDEVRMHCEQPVNGIGSIDLRWQTGKPTGADGGCTHRSVAFVGDHILRVNGRRYLEAQPPRKDVPIDGYIIDGELLASAIPVRRLDPGDLSAAKQSWPIANPDQLDPMTGNPASTAALIAGKIYHFENENIIGQVEAALVRADQQAQQDRTHTIHHGFDWLEADGGTYLSDSHPVSETPFLADQIKVLFIRVNFTDINPATATKTELESALASTRTTLQNYSYGTANITATVSANTYSLGLSTTYSGNANGSDNLLTAARNAASAHYVLSNYDVVAVYFPQLSGPDFGYAGLASVGGSNHWINGLTNPTSLVSVLVHEFGHNYGLFHANYWDPAAQIAGDYSDPANSSLEYGDIFDRMGSGSDVSSGYFNPFATTRLNWLPPGKTHQPTDNGTWRIYRFDSPSALNNPLLALRIPMGGTEYWWVGLRKLYPTISTSAYVVAEGLYPSHSNLMDLTPGSQSPESNDRTDAPLPVGASYYSASHGVRIRTLASGGSAPNEWIDVQIEFDSRLQFAKTSLEVDENLGSALLTVSRTNGSAGAASIRYSTSNGTAIAGSDFLASSGTVTWSDGDSTDKQILIPIRPDALSDGGETFHVTLSNPSGAALVSTQSVATITLRDAGQRLTDFNSSFFNTTVNAIVPLSSGKVIIGGSFTSGFSGNITRLHANGTEDSSFVKGTGFNGGVNSIVELHDGSFLVGGDFTSYNSVSCNRIAKLSANGSLDTSFVVNTAGGADDSIHCLAIETSGKVLVGGSFSSFAGTTANGLVRILSNGLPDNLLPIQPEYAAGAEIRAMIAQSDGKIMVTGTLYVGWTGSGFRSGVLRLHPNGTRDTSFDPDAGLHTLGQVAMISNSYAIAQQQDGKYLVGGYFSAYDENPVSNIVRILSNGQYDPSFAPPAFGSGVHSILAMPGGTMLVAGTFSSPVSRLERLLPNGSADTNFNQGSGPSGAVYHLKQGPDGAVWLGGNFYQYNGTSVWPLVKIASGTSPYQLWAASQFSQAQFLAGTTDPEDDPDNDGMSNLAEMAIGSSPGIANPNHFGALVGSTQLVSFNAERYLQASFARNPAQPGIWVAAQFSNDLNSWLPTSPLPGENPVCDIIEQSPSRLTVRDKTPLAPGMPHRFMRFVVLPPQ